MCVYIILFFGSWANHLKQHKTTKTVIYSLCFLIKYILHQTIGIL